MEFGFMTFSCCNVLPASLGAGGTDSSVWNSSWPALLIFRRHYEPTYRLFEWIIYPDSQCKQIRSSTKTLVNELTVRRAAISATLRWQTRLSARVETHSVQSQLEFRFEIRDAAQLRWSQNPPTNNKHLKIIVLYKKKVDLASLYTPLNSEWFSLKKKILGQLFNVNIYSYLWRQEDVSVINSHKITLILWLQWSVTLSITIRKSLEACTKA